MYIPKRFNDGTDEEIRQFIKKYNFATITGEVDGRIWACHIPLQYFKKENGDEYFFGHISRANKLGEHLKTDQEILAIFQGPHAYISPSWYDKINVPTWNYVAVHIYGSTRCLEGDELKLAMANQMQDNEAKYGNNLTMDDLPPEMVKADMRGLIGFEMKIEEIKAAHKLSQNKNDASYDGVIENLNQNKGQQGEELAHEMRIKRAKSE